MTGRKTFLILIAFGFCAGCFRHQEAPERPLTATSVVEAEKNISEVNRVVLNDQGLDAVPTRLTSMPSLTILYLRGNQLADCSALAGLKGVEELDLSLNTFTNAPAELAGLVHLRRLYLTECGLTVFPDLSSLTELEYLNLDRNAIEAIPSNLPSSLRWLRLNGNKVAMLPDSIGSLSSLQRLYLENNHLSALPDSLEGLSLLEDIDLSGNALVSFPEVLLRLPKLRNLDLRGNTGLAKLPENIGEMKSLRTLVLAQCPLPEAERKRVRAALPHCVINF